ncbi:unnamed protein product [Rhizoctonia solani]|uniref:Uncharacterized protein n=1 Tax=Rhizoctonia solani TaxID=456999 RepID=A0A8H3ACF0_9AGAM|nr:unnamed protein product [Rhizoctonia solani]
MSPPAKDYSFCMDRIARSGGQYTCTVCLGKNGKSMGPLPGSRMAEHVKSSLHQKRVETANARMQDNLGPLAGPSQSGHLMPHDLYDSGTNRPILGCDSFSTSPNMVPDDETITPPTPPMPSYDFFQDAAYESIGEHDPAATFAAQLRTEFPAPEQRTLLPLWSKSSATRANPYNDKTWDPYGNKSLFLTHSLFNAPAIRFSEAQQMAILDWAFEMGARDVPSMYQLDKCSQKIKGLMGDSSTRMFKTQTGHIFYLNQVNGFLRQDFANRRIREQMEFYPHDCDGFMSEVWHGEKMSLGCNRDQLTPMVSHGGRSFFVNELTLLDDGSLFLTDMFLKHRGELSARGRKFEAQDPTIRGPNYFRFDDKIIDYPVSKFQRSCIELTSSYPDGIVVSNVMKETKSGMITSYLTLSEKKQMDASLPREKLNERLNIRFMSTSQYASPIEMMEAIQTDFDEAFDNPVVVWDAMNGREVLVRPYIHFISGDNPMQAEECSALGLKSNLFCRTCRVGGPHKFKISAKGFPLQMQVIREERQDSGTTRSAIKHKDYGCHLVNLLALHNSQPIRQLVQAHFDCFTPFQSLTEYSNICKDAVAALQAKELATDKPGKVQSTLNIQATRAKTPQAESAVGQSQGFAPAGPSRKRQRN